MRGSRMKNAATPKNPVLEQIVTDAGESFVWRRDDYPQRRTVWNVHPECEIHLIRKSSGFALIGDYIGDFGPGELMMVGSGLPHDWVTPLGHGETVPERDVVLQFNPARFVCDSLPELAGLRPLLARCRRGLRFTGATRREGAALMEGIGDAAGLERLAFFLCLLGRLARSTECEVLSSEHFDPSLDPAAMQVFRRVMEFVLDNFAQGIRLGDAASVAGMNESAFSRFFQRCSGNSFSDTITKLRLGRACKLLADTDEPITEICFEVGYANISNFNRSFRQQRGVTPSAYRRLARRLRG